MPYTVLGMRARWLPRRPTSRAGVQRARVTALILFAATTALAVLLAILSHLAWPPVLVGILATAPALYVAWLAVPGVISPPEPAKKLAHGRPVAQWNPVDLGVHQVIGGGPMPIYIRRPHDELLRAVMDPAVPTSRLVVVRGGSSTGKTRAAYEAVADRLADWQLDYPLNVAALAARLDAGIPARTVLWLGELRQYADADGGPAVLGRLADLLQGEDHLVITTVWPEQWNTYTAAARAGPGTADPAGTAGRLLERLPELTASDPAGIDPARGGVIEVPARFTTAEMTTAATAGDSVLAEAAAAAASAGKDGQVTQFLAGVPDLLRRYVGPGGDPYGQAVITAAMDAARLGHASPLPAALVQEAAVGYLTGPQRTEDIASWRDTALAWATEELKGAVRALQPVPPPSGTGVAGYQVADYLDQHGRRNRQDQLGPPSLWDALTARTASASDLARLGQAARDRGLYRHAAALWTTAATLGSTNAARQLITHLRQVSPVDTTRAAQWAVSHASLDDPWAVAELLGTLDAAGVSDAAAALASRAAGHASVDDPQAVAWLLRALDAAGASDAVTALASRAAGHASVDDPQAVAELLRALDEAGASGAAAALLARDPAGHASVDDPQAVAELLRALDAAGASDAVTALASRAAGHASVDDPRAVAELLGALDAAGASGAAAALASRAAGHASLDDPWAVAELLGALDAAGASGAAAALASPGRRPRQPRRPVGRRRAAGGAGRGRGQRRGRRPGEPGPPATPASTTRGPSPSCWGRWTRPGPAARPPPWRAGPPATPASTTRGPSPSCCGRWTRPGPAARPPPCWPATPPATPASTTRRPSPSCCGRWTRPGPAARPPPCWPATPPATPASTTRRPSPGCWRRWTRPGPAARPPPCWPATPPATPASTTRRPSPGCWRRYGRPGPAAWSPPWPAGPPTRACSISSSRSTPTRPPATCSDASQTEPHRNPGNGKSRPARTAVCRCKPTASCLGRTGIPRLPPVAAMT